MSERQKIDQIDKLLLDALQRDADLSQRDLADLSGQSQNACWRRLRRLRDSGLIKGSQLRLDKEALGLDLTVFMMIKTRNHSIAWSDAFRAHVSAIPEVTELHRIGGEWDYLIRAVTDGMGGYDRLYRQIISRFELETVTGFFSMETIFEGRPLVVRPGG